MWDGYVVVDLADLSRGLGALLDMYGFILQVLGFGRDGFLREHDVKYLWPCLVDAFLAEQVSDARYHPVGKDAEMQVGKAGYVALMIYGTQVKVDLHAAEWGPYYLIYYSRICGYLDILGIAFGVATLQKRIKITYL